MMCMGWSPLKQCGQKASCEGNWFWLALIAAALFGHHKGKKG